MAQSYALNRGKPVYKEEPARFKYNTSKRPTRGVP
jgi:hypothetical protein